VANDISSVILDTKDLPQKSALGGAYEGASVFAKELAGFNPAIRSADADLLRDKPRADARARDIGRNDGYAAGAVAIHKDSIVGSQYTLNAQPDVAALSTFSKAYDETWAEEFQRVVEARFTLYAESINNYLDASRHDTLTELIRLAIGVYVYAGEVLASVEWMRDGVRPYSTAIQMIEVDRLSNPLGKSDSQTLRGGVERNRYGAPVAYNIRDGYANDPFSFNLEAFNWRRVPIRKPWGRMQMLHIYERARPDQSRGISEMVAVLKQMKMTSRYQDIVLQNAVVNATYAATIESELPRDVAMEMIGADNTTTADISMAYLAAIAKYTEGSKNVNIDGVKIPHLFPGTKLQLRPAGQAGGVGTEFEQSLLRHTAAALGLSYEEFSRDYSKSNYSSARASMTNTWKYMQSRKKTVADKLATNIYWLVLEEMVNKNELPMPKGFIPDNFYEGMFREALGGCSWISAARGQIDEMKETEAAMLKIASGLSTWEEEVGKLGKDWRKVFAQRLREQKYIADNELNLNLSTAGGPALAAVVEDPAVDENGDAVPPKKPVAKKKKAPTEKK
jgi:lambda family phage portal protein